jgi:hypothetical protein
LVIGCFSVSFIVLAALVPFPLLQSISLLFLQAKFGGSLFSFVALAAFLFFSENATSVMPQGVLSRASKRGACVVHTSFIGTQPLG